MTGKMIVYEGVHQNANDTNQKLSSNKNNKNCDEWSRRVTIEPASTPNTLMNTNEQYPLSMQLYKRHSLQNSNEHI